MTEEKYLALRAAGVDQFSVSLDFPDDRHDDFRAYPGLYRHLEDLIPRLARLGHDDIVLNSCITSENVGEIEAIADKAREWGVNLCYSAYSARRTGCREYFPGTPEQLAEIEARLGRVEARRDQTNWIVNSPSTLAGTRRYFAHRGAPGCTAGMRFLVVTADGALQPCSMQFHRYPLEERARMVARIHAPQPVRRVLRFHPLVPGQELPPPALGERERVPGEITSCAAGTRCPCRHRAGTPRTIRANPGPRVPDPQSPIPTPRTTR